MNESNYSSISEVTIYTCSDCHTSFCIASPVSFCIYCSGRNLSSESMNNFGSYQVIPFTIDLKQACSFYKNKVRFNPLIPLKLRSRSFYSKIRKMYVPCLLSDFQVDGNIIFLGADKIEKIKGMPMQKFECCYSTQFQYHNILSCTYSKIGNELLNAIQDYDFSSLSSVDSSMLKDCFFIKGDLDQNNIVNQIEEKIVKNSVGIVRGNITHGLKKLNSNQAKVSISSSSCVFVPVYYLNIIHKGKNKYYMMNGQTGKTISDFPISISCFILFSFIVFSIVFGIISFIFYMI